MKIALVHYAVPPVVGGVESVLAQQARLLRQAGHEVRLIAARGESLAPDIPLARLPLADSQHPRILAAKAELDLGQVPADFAALVDEISESLAQILAGMDAVLAHNVCSLAKNLALTASLHRLNASQGFPRLILWHHDLAWTTPRYRAELHSGYPWDLLRTDWPGATQVVVSEARQAELAALLGLPPERIRVVPNGVDSTNLFKLEPATTALAHAMGLEAAAPLLLLPVRLTPRKNIELALHSLAALRKLPRVVPDGEAGGVDFQNAALLVTGPEGPHNAKNANYRRMLLDLRDRLDLAGAAHFAVEHSPDYLPDSVVADFFRLADALILPSREEGFGIPLIEAALARLPVFCADIAPLRQLGGNDVAYFSPGADPGTVASLIAHRLAADPAYRFSARARASYTWSGIYREHIAPLLGVAGH